MKIRGHKSLALVAVGWMLMRPPVNWNNEVLKDVPMNHWQQTRSFDTAEQCERYRQWLTQQQEPSTIPPGFDPVPGTVWQEQANLAQCVSADDPRIAPANPPRPYTPMYP